MSYQILNGDALTMLGTLPDASVHCCVTSPPYWGLRDYGHDGQLGLEKTPVEYVANMVKVFAEVRRVLRDDGTCWINLGDSYTSGGRSSRDPGQSKLHPAFTGDDNRTTRERAETPPGLKPKDLVGIPWRVAFALQADGWYLRQDIIWHKPNPMPESVRDRCTKAHEYIFLLSKSERYHFDADAIRVPLKPASVERGLYPHRSFGKGQFNGSPIDERHQEGKAVSLVSDLQNPAGANRRSVWTINTKPYKNAHFAVFPPELPELCIRAGCPEAGKRCDCDQLILTPTGEGAIDDPSKQTGRAGMNRPRREGEGSRPITRREQRGYAEQMKESPHRAEMERICGSAFAHYIRTDDNGARPLPPALLDDFSARGWLRPVPPCEHPVEPAGTVLDPFAGSGTTLAVAEKWGRNSIGIELNPAYLPLIQKRLAKEVRLFA
jgi:DNA modification methylase